MLELRNARQKDRHLLWNWANDPIVRAASFSTEPILWQQHQRWFESKLKDPNCIIYIATLKGKPVGQARFERAGGNESQATISASVAAEYRNRGFGSTMIELACLSYFKTCNVNKIYAFIKPNNRASIRAFEKAGFQNRRIMDINSSRAVRLLLKREGVA